MKGLVNSMGLKGIIIFLLVIVVGGYVTTMNLMGGVGLEILGCIMLGLYLDAYATEFKVMLENKAEQNKQSLMEQFSQQNSIMDEMKKLYRSQAENLINIAHTNNEEQKNIILESRIIYDKSIKSSSAETQQICKDAIISAMTNAREDMTKSMTKVGQTYQELSGVLGSAFTNIDENLVVFRNALENDIVEVAKLQDGMSENHKNCITAIDSHNEKLNKIIEFVEKTVVQEEIEDKANAAIAFNTKKDGLTIHSELRDNNQLTFMAGYKDGKLIYNKSFDKDGYVTSECFFDNKGQVKERRTYQNSNGEIKVHIDKK